MRLQLVVSILSAVLLSTVMSKSLSEIPSVSQLSSDVKTREANTSEESVVHEKTHKYEKGSFHDNIIYFCLGMVACFVLIVICHLTFDTICKPDKLQRRAYDRMLRNEGRRHRYNHWPNFPVSYRGISQPDISSPVAELPSSMQNYPMSTLYSKMNELCTQAEQGADDRALRHLYGTHNPRRVTISSPCVTSNSSNF